MDVQTLIQFRFKLAQDADNRSVRGAFHENYGMFEGYLSHHKSNEFDKFSAELGAYYWQRQDLKDVAKELSFYPPVGNSKTNFEPTPTIERATYHLRTIFELALTDEEIKMADRWKKHSLIALLEIVKQVRNNLFHGMKMQLNQDEYDRNKQLVTLANRIIVILLDNLEEAYNKSY